MVRLMTIEDYERVYSLWSETKGALVVFKTNEIGNLFWKSQGWQEREDLNYYNKPFDLNNI